MPQKLDIKSSPFRRFLFQLLVILKLFCLYHFNWRKKY